MKWEAKRTHTGCEPMHASSYIAIARDFMCVPKKGKNHNKIKLHA